LCFTGVRVTESQRDREAAADREERKAEEKNDKMAGPVSLAKQGMALV